MDVKIFANYSTHKIDVHNPILLSQDRARDRRLFFFQFCKAAAALDFV